MEQELLEKKLVNLAKNAVHDLKNWGDVDLEWDEFLKMVSFLDDRYAEYFIDEVNHPGAYEDDDVSGLDTIVRDMVFDVVGEVTAGRSWPISAEGQEAMDEFMQDLRTHITTNQFEKSEIDFGHYMEILNMISEEQVQ